MKSPSSEFLKAATERGFMHQCTDIDALDEIAGRFRAIIAEHGAEALMPLSYLGTQGVVQRLALNRVFNLDDHFLHIGGPLDKGCSKVKANPSPLFS